MHRRIAIFLFLLACSNCYGQAESPTAKIEAILSTLHEAGDFNGVVLAAEKGHVAYLKAFGDADLEGTPLETDSVFRLASVSKAFTGMAITMLRDEGKLSIKDDVRKHLNEFPYEGVTIRHLLHHTSGLPDYVSLLEEHWDVENKSKPQKRKIARSPDALRMLIKHKPKIQFAPGEKHEYSNTGYITLGLIVQRVSGKPFGQFLHERIFEPLEMKNTVLFNPKSPPEISKQVIGFRKIGTGKAKNDENFLNGMFGDGEVYSTVEDMLKWDQALYTDQLVSKKSINEILTPGKTNDEKSCNYGYGWGIAKKYDHRVASHGGGWVGFRTWLERDLDANRTLIILTNNTSSKLGQLKKQLQPIVFQSGKLLKQ